MYYVVLSSYVLIFFLMYTNLSEYKRSFAVGSTLLFSTLAFFFNPIKAVMEGNYIDLYRIYQELDMFRLYGWNADKTIVYKNYYYLSDLSGLPIVRIYWWLISRFKDNGWLPFINTFLIFIIMFMSINIISKKLKLSNVQTTSAFVFWILIEDYSRTVANVRMPLALAIFTLALAYDVSRDKEFNWLSWLGYILTTQLHNAMFIFVVIRIIVEFYRNKNTKKLALFLCFALLLMYNSIIKIISGISILSGKVELYTSNGTGGIAGLKLFGIKEVILLLAEVLICFYIFYKLNKYTRQSNTVTVTDRLIFFGEILLIFGIFSELITIHLTNRIMLFEMDLLPIYILILKKFENDESSVLALPITNRNIGIWIFTIISVLYFFGTHTYKVFVF